MSWSGLAPELVWGLLPRFVGLLYIVAFGALTFQLVGIIGKNGAASIDMRLTRIRRDFPGIRRFFDFPTVFWLNSSDGMIRAVPMLGVLCGVLACYGGPVGYVGLLLGWFLWNSVEPAGLIFPWDTLLQEVGFLTLFLPLGEELPSLQASALPLPTVAFMFRWLVIRLMLGFAKVKFIGTGKGDSMYLRGFLIWAPLPTPIAWWAHHAPRWILKASLAFMFFGEAIAPVLGLFTGPLRLISFATMTALMVGIHITGNWGYFNIGYILLSVCLLDSQSSIFDMQNEPWASTALTWPDLAIHSAMVVMFLTSLVFFIVMNSWISRTWVHWLWEQFTWNKPWARAIIGYFRAIAPWHIVNGYGVFPPYASAPLRYAPVIEGSLDGKEWKAYGYRYLPTTPKGKLPIVAPHHPRFDQALHYYALGMHDSSYFSSLIGDGSPYLAYSRNSWLERGAQRLLTNDPEIKRELGDNPFPDTAPNFVRVSCYGLAPTSPRERKETGDLWRVRRIGELMPPQGHAPWMDEQSVPEPELFHPDYAGFKARAFPLCEIVRLFKEGVDPDQAVLAVSDLTSEEVERFWSVFVPALAEHRGEWDKLHEHAADFAARFHPVELYRFERLLGRFSWLLRTQTDRHFVQGQQPKIELISNWRYEMLTQEIVIDGREDYLSILREPSRAAERARRTTDQTQLWALAMIRYDVMIFHVRTFRWHEIGNHGARYKVHGIFEYNDMLQKIVPLDEEWRPLPKKQPDGEFIVDGIYYGPNPQISE
jgi:lipase maturation factor 1